MSIVTGFTPHHSQQILIDGILNSEAKYHVANIARQWGKSILAMNLSLYWMINSKKPVKVLWVAPVYSQTNKVHKELYEAIASSGIVKSNNYSDSSLQLYNGSEIIFRSAERYDNIRGMTVDYAIIDEAAFIKEEAWNNAIKPTLLVKGKKVLFISTPRGKNWFNELWHLGNSNDHPSHKSYTGTSYETPFISSEELDEAKKTLPPNVFKQEYLAEFIDDGGTVFTNIDRCVFTKYTKGVGPYYAGIDLGRANDFTVCTIMDSNGLIVDMYRDNKQEWSVMTSHIIAILKKWNATAMVEVNSIGDVIFEQLKKAWVNTHPFVTTSKSKNEIIEGLILDMNNNTIGIPSKDLSELYNELSYFTYEYNPKTRNIRYGHPVGLHDDTVMSTAISNFNRKNRKTYGKYSYAS